MENEFDNRAATVLNSYIFDKVWNDPFSEFRKNVRLPLLSKPIARRYMQLQFCSINLPTDNDFFLVYFIPYNQFGGLNIDVVEEWTSVKDLIDARELDVVLHDVSGRLIPRTEIQLMKNPDEDTVLVAVKKSTADQIFGRGFDIKNIIAAIYVDSDNQGDVETTTVVVDENTNVAQLFADTSAATFTYVNGKYTQVLTEDDINVNGAFVEYINDGDVTGSFTVDLAVNDDRRNFVSTLDGKSKAIIHIPKALNPDNKVISHHTLTFHFLPRNVEFENRGGAMLQRGLNEWGLSQLTHNDLSIPEVIINSYHDVLNIDEMTLVVHVRNHSKNNNLIREKNYLTELYTLDDDTIIDFLANESENDMPHWEASYLEASEYAKSISDQPDFITPDNLNKYIDVLGYYEALNLLCPRVTLYPGLPKISGTFLTTPAGEYDYATSLTTQGLELVENVALTGTATMSSDYNSSNTANFKALHANDGVIDSVLFHMAHTENELAPWLKVDLTNKEPIAKVVIHNRQRVRKSRFTDFSILIEDSNGVVLARHDQPGFGGSIYEATDFYAVDEDGNATTTRYYYTYGDTVRLQFAEREDLFLAGQRSINIREMLIYSTIPNGSTTNKRNYDFRLTIPPVFESRKVYPLVTRNGIKVHDSDIHVSYCSATELIVRIEPGVEATDEVMIELFEAVGDKVIKVIPTIGNHKLLMGTDIFEVFEVLTLNGVKTHVKVTDLSEVADFVNLAGSDTLVFEEGTYGREFVVVFDVGFHRLDFDIDPILINNGVLEFDLETKVTGAVIDETFVLATHEGPTTEHGSLLDQNDLLALNARPAWNLLNRDENYNFASRWEAPLGDDGARAKFSLNPAYRNRYYIIGYKLGAAPNPTDSARIVSLPTSFDLLIDDVIVDSVRNETWYGGDVIHEFMLNQPVLVDTTIELHLHERPEGFEQYSSVDYWEPIFGYQTFESSVPLIGEMKVIPFLNGKELIEEIDYTVEEIKEPVLALDHDEEFLVKRKLFINNAAYLETSDNTLEVIITRSKQIGEQSGYVEQDTLLPLESNIFWFNRLSKLIVDGKTTYNQGLLPGQLVTDVSEFRYGAPFGTRTLVPKAAQVFLDRFNTSDDDDVILNAVANYFGSDVPEVNGPILLPYSHRIVSVYLATIICKVLSGDLILDYDPNPDNIEAQASEYAYLKKYDVALKELSGVDRDYVDIQPSYTNPLDQNTLLARTIRELTAKVLEDTVHHGRPSHEP